jgi:hypothetical protein
MKSGLRLSGFFATCNDIGFERWPAEEKMVGR